MMRATTFEFRYRFWIIGAIFWLGFSLAAVDSVNAAVAMAGWLAAHTALSQRILVRLIFSLGGLLTVLAALLRTWGTSFLGSDVMHDETVHSERLVADGPYSYVRNPLYLGTTLLTLGMGLLASRIGYAVIVIGVLIFDLRLIGREEAELSASQGESYRLYLQRVPRFIPSLRPRVEAAGRPSRWNQALLGEGFIWGFAAATVTFAVTLKSEYAWITLALAFVIYAWSKLTLRKQRQALTGQ